MKTVLDDIKEVNFELFSMRIERHQEKYGEDDEFLFVVGKGILKALGREVGEQAAAGAEDLIKSQEPYRAQFVNSVFNDNVVFAGILFEVPVVLDRDAEDLEIRTYRYGVEEC